MLRRVREIAMKAPLLLMCIAGHAAPPASYPMAKVTVNGTEQPIGGSWDNGNITIDFNGFLETVHYGQFSSDASLASALAAMFTRDYRSFGLYAKAGANSNADPSVITFQLANGSSFGPFNVTGPSTSFTFTPTGFSSTPPGVPDQGVAALLFNGAAIATASYGDGSTPASIAQDLAHKASSPLVTVTAEGPNVYLQSKQAGTYSDTYSLSFSTALSFSSSPGGTLSGSSETASVPVYSYSVTNSSGQSGYDAVGNVDNVTDSVMGTWAYSYDTLNRLVSGVSFQGPHAGQFACWSYDNFGNRTHQSFSNQPFVNASCVPAAGASLIDTAVGYGVNNQINSVTSPALNVVYDGAGNVKNDGNNSYLYDAEGRICALRGPLGMTGYQYDAVGNRVGRGSITSMSCDVTQNGYQPASDYVLDLSGNQMTEVSVGNGQSVWQHTNVTADGALIATYDTAGLHFYLNDALGSRRVQTDPAGFPEQTCQNLPFGDQLYCTGSLNSPTEHHFTGKERDTESGLDYFGARYYASSMGRWMSPDWAEKPEAVPYSSLDNPQSLNLYGYVNNNPLSKADPDGHDASDVLKLAGAAELVAPEATPIIVGVAAGALVVGAIHDNWDSISNGFHNIFSKGDSPAPAAPAAPAAGEKTGEPPQLAGGREAHNNEEVRPGEKAEVPTPSKTGRMDRYDPEKRHIREIKPDNPRGEKSGQKQLQRYKAEMDKTPGQPHTTELTKYPPPTPKP